MAEAAGLHKVVFIQNVAGSHAAFSAHYVMVGRIFFLETSGSSVENGFQGVRLEARPLVKQRDTDMKQWHKAVLRSLCFSFSPSKEKFTRS